MSIADEIEKLRRLHASGALTDEEFARAKEEVIRNPNPIPILMDDEYLPRSEAESGSRWYLGSAFLVPLLLVAFVAIFAAVALPKFREGQKNLEKYRQEVEQREKR